MKLFLIILLFAFNSIQSQNFEGELNYTAKMDGYVIYKSDTLKFKDVKDKMIKKGEYFDSLDIKINDLGYVKKINNGKNETVILNFNEKKKYITEIWKIVNWREMEERYINALEKSRK